MKLLIFIYGFVVAGLTALFYYSFRSYYKFEAHLRAIDEAMLPITLIAVSIFIIGSIVIWKSQ